MSNPSLPLIPKHMTCPLPNGCTLYMDTDKDTGIRHYYSDEVGGGVSVWYAGLVSAETLLQAIVEEARITRLEAEHKRRNPV